MVALVQLVRAEPVADADLHPAGNVARAGQQAHALSLSKAASAALTEHWKYIATSAFNWGGLAGTLLTIPVAKLLGRKPMFAIYFALSAVSLFVTFHMTWPPEVFLRLYFLNGLTLFGLFGSFTYYLPELYPVEIRGMGAGFCYNRFEHTVPVSFLVLIFLVQRSSHHSCWSFCRGFR